MQRLMAVAVVCCALGVGCGDSKNGGGTGDGSGGGDATVPTAGGACSVLGETACDSANNALLGCDGSTYQTQLRCGPAGRVCARVSASAFDCVVNSSGGDAGSAGSGGSPGGGGSADGGGSAGGGGSGSGGAGGGGGGGSGGGNGGGGDGGTSDGGSTGGGMTGCDQTHTSMGSSGFYDTDLHGYYRLSSYDFNQATQQLNSELAILNGPGVPVGMDLDLSTMSNIQTCNGAQAACVIVLTPENKIFLAQSGTLRFSSLGAAPGEQAQVQLTNVKFREVDQGSNFGDVPGGDIFCAASAAVSTTLTRFPCAFEGLEPGHSACGTRNNEGTVVQCKPGSPQPGMQDFGELTPGDNCLATGQSCVESAPGVAACTGGEAGAGGGDAGAGSEAGGDGGGEAGAGGEAGDAGGASGGAES